MKILRPFTGTGAVFFPIGIPPIGTCEFATHNCRKYCYASLPEYPDFDEELLVSEEDKREIYEVFCDLPVKWIVEEILRELDGLQTDILHWFGSGDCMTKDMPKILDIINALDESPAMITQMGFTRNVNLWEQRKDIFALTVESEEEINDRAGMFSVTDYVEGTSKMFCSQRPTRGGLCGPELCQDRIEKKLTHFINCQTCRRLKTGCFDRGIEG